MSATSRRASRSSGGFFDLPALKTQLAALESQMAAGSFWDNAQAAQKVIGEANAIRAKLDPLKVREVLQRQAEILATGGGNGGKLPLSQAGRIEELLAQVGRASVTGDAKELFKKLQNIDEIKGTKKPRNLKAQLRPYQEQGFQWLWFLHEIGSGGVLADDMGLGKTVQALA